MHASLRAPLQYGFDALQCSGHIPQSHDAISKAGVDTIVLA
jgi:hypothetical protein